MGTNLGVQVLLVRSLTKGDYGIFAYALSVIATIGTVSTFGLDRGLARFVAMYEERGDTRKVWGTIVLQMTTIVGIGLSTVAVVIGFHGWIGRSVVDNPRLGSLLAVMVLLAPVQAVDNMAGALFSVFAKPKAIFVRRFVLAPVLRLAIVGLLALGNRDIFFLGIGYVVAGIFGLLLYGSLMRRTLRARGLLTPASPGQPRFDLPIAEVTAFTLPLLASDAMFVVLNTSDVVILGHTAGSAAVGSYRSVLPIARLNQLVLNSFSMLFAPLMARLWARGDREALGEAYWQTAAWVAVLSFPVLAFSLGLAGPLTTTLFGARYAGSVPYPAHPGAGLLLQRLSGVQRGDPQDDRAGVAGGVDRGRAALVFNLAANLLLIPAFGAMGAACGTGASVAFYNLAKQWGLRRGSGVRVFEPRYAPLYATIVLGAAVLLAVDLTAMSVVVRVLAVAAATALVLWTGRHLLMVGDLFPELRRVPLMGRLLGPPSPSEPGS